MITWVISEESQKKLYKSYLLSIQSGYYGDKKFYILPFMPEKFRSRVIFFPKNPDFKHLLNKHSKQIEELKSEWQKVETLVMERLEKLFPQIGEVELVIEPQMVGSMGSTDIEGNKLIVHPRFERKIGGLVMLIINGLTRYFGRDLVWSDKQEMAFENYQKVNIDNIFSKNKSLLTTLDRNVSGKLAQESETYLLELGVKKQTKVNFSKLLLTKKEKLILDLLVENKNKLVGTEKIAETIWGEQVEEKYSLYAISKLVDRLRQKIRDETGQNLIHNQRGSGYILHI
jgi:hypothetical protein